jgi:small subunit ribosomal protein S20
MPNTKSAERRMRSNARRHQHNQSAQNRLKTLEKKLAVAITASKKEAASTAYRALSSALDKAAKTGLVHSNTARRKKSRLAGKLAGLPA